MAFVTITCPQCGGQAQIEAGRNAICPYCGTEISLPAADGGFAYAPAEAQQRAAQFAPPPAQTVMQDPSVFGNQPAVSPAQPYQQQYVMPQYTQEQLQTAEKKRRGWHFMNAGMAVIQALVLGLVVFMDSIGSDAFVPLVLGWLMSLPVCGFISGMMRPDSAYLDKKPMFRSKIVQGIMQSIIGGAVSVFAGIILIAFMDMFF
ncbi:MAG: hypothetical protein IKG82_07970 [Oscillospiraceae bacterium]|nr:hypothetical protein [Oscillospiraceae bacterium]